MSDDGFDQLNVGGLAAFLESTPGPHRIGGHVMRHVRTFDGAEWLGIKDARESSEP